MYLWQRSAESVHFTCALVTSLKLWHKSVNKNFVCCGVQRADVADARSVLCDKRILEIVCLNSICNSSRCSAEKVRGFRGECANMRICMRMCNRRIFAYSHIGTLAYSNMPMCEYASNLTDVKISGTHWKCIENCRQSISLYFVNLCHYKWGWGLRRGQSPLPSKETITFAK